MSVTCIHLIIHGRVQGVGYRRWLADQAKQAKVTGWVRNRDDSTVEAVLCGDSAAVQQLQRDCERGALASHVLRVEVSAWTGEVPKDFQQLENVAAA